MPISSRQRQPELMDDPGLDRARHVQALVALARINVISRTAERIWRELVRIHRATGAPVRVLDVACGGGDVLRSLATRARRAGVPVELAGCDASPVALEEARRRGEAAGVETLRLDVLHDPLPEGFDLVTSSLFLHHLGAEEAAELLARMAASARRALLVQDLRRTRLGYLYAWVALHALTRSDVARTDGLRSVRSAFTVDEARAICRASGLDRARVERVWPQRFLVRWSRA